MKYFKGCIIVLTLIFVFCASVYAADPSPSPTATPTTSATYAAPADSAQDDDSVPFIPRSASNDIYKITVTSVEKASSKSSTVAKGTIQAKAGFKFIIVYFSQENLTPALQTYAGKFYLIDEDNNKYSWVSGISNYWLIVFRPYGINFGYLTFEVPLFADPAYLYLDMGNRPPISVALTKAPLPLVP